MRRLNLFLVIGMFVTFIAHGIMGALKLCGANTDAWKLVGCISIAFICAHVVVTAILTGQTLKTMKKTGTGYFRENKLFWVRRISGLTILIPLVMHLMIFQGTAAPSGAYRLVVFNTGRMISQVLLVVTIAFHALTNIKPLLIALGVRETKAFALDLLLILSAVLLFFAVAFAVYYLRWLAV